jgi:Uma2 family endonuclease
MLDIEFPLENQTIIDDMPSLNHSYICSKILRQLFANEKIEALTELTLDIDNGLTPDICVYPEQVIQPNFLHDVHKFSQMPMLAIEVISASQNIQTLLEKAERMIQAGIKSVWTVEPYSQTIFVTTAQGVERIYNQTVEFEAVKVGFQKIFA